MSNGNKLINVVDLTNFTEGFHDGNKKGVNGNTDDDYEYDTYGNLIVDNNKGITEIIYNHLNLPKKITFDKIFENNTEVKGTIEYLYNANGTKLKKTVKVDGNPNHRITHYTNGYQYSGDKLDFFPTAEGYVNVTWASGTPGGPQIANYNYVYNYTDHLGNIRLRYAINPVNQWLEILEEDHYYPFGLKQNGYNAQNYVFGTLGDGPVELIPTNPNLLDTYKYQYQGQELQEELGLNWYSFKWRNSSPDLGRFWVIDPLAEQYVHNSTYAFSENRVVDAVELEGLEAVKVTDLKNNQVNVTVSVKPINSTTIYPVSNEQINSAMNNFKSITEQSFSGTSTEGLNVTVSVNIDENATLTVDFVDFINNPEIQSDDFEGNILNTTQGVGFTSQEDFGNTQTGNIQISGRNTFEHQGVGKPIADPGHSGSHELGHIFNLNHNQNSGNLMKEGANSSERNITPAQRTEMLNNIPEKKKEKE